MHRSLWSSLSVVALGASVAACSTPAGVGGVAPVSMGPSAQVGYAPVAAPATQWILSCQPHQQAQVQTTIRDGVQVSEATCVDRVAAYPAGSVVPMSRAAAVPVTPVSHEYVSLGDEVAVVPRSSVRTRPAVYTTVDDEPVRRPVRRVAPKRTWQKSAVIIGSSAGAGAGVGALLGGKKGALIGAAIGGGGATVWDQVTRRKD